MMLFQEDLLQMHDSKPHKLFDVTTANTHTHEHMFTGIKDSSLMAKRLYIWPCSLASFISRSSRIKCILPIPLRITSCAVSIQKIVKSCTWYTRSITRSPEILLRLSYFRCSKELKHGKPGFAIYFRVHGPLENMVSETTPKVLLCQALHCNQMWYSFQHEKAEKMIWSFADNDL